jgi:hypothetical protein
LAARRRVFFLQNGVLLGGGSFMYFVGSYTLKEGTFKGECVAIRIRLPQPVTFISTRRMSAWVSWARMRVIIELTATVLLGKRSLTLHATLRKLADI